MPINTEYNKVNISNLADSSYDAGKLIMELCYEELTAEQVKHLGNIQEKLQNAANNLANLLKRSVHS